MADERRARQTMRCAVYTRKSSEEGLDQSFNSLHAQREACEAYIGSQKHEGWKVLRTVYDDGGFSGGTMERPALQLLLSDIRKGLVDVVVVYKIDRLTRSLFDFAKIVEIFEAANVSFVSITQSFNTTTSMGRLTLNVLLSFAQFEREVTGERIRDKIAASKRKGMWMGGNIPLGYDLKDRKLVPNLEEAAVIRTIFETYLRCGTVRVLKEELDRKDLRTRKRTTERPDGSHRTTGGIRFGTGHLYWILRNPIYIGMIRHRGELHPGEHEPLVARELWDEVRRQLSSNAVARRLGKRTANSSLLAGRIFTMDGRRLTPSHTVKGTRRYRYYATTGNSPSNPAIRLPAHALESLVADAVSAWLGDPHAVLDWLQPNTEGISNLETALERAKRLSRTRIEEAGDSCVDLDFPSLIERVGLDEGSIKITVSSAALASALQIDCVVDHAAQPLVIEQAISLKRKGREQKLIVTSSTASGRNPDPALLSALARARRWFGKVKAQEVESIADLARVENVNRAWISNQLALAFLAPDITEAVLNGTQPVTLTLDHLVEIANTSSDWSLQRQAFRAA
jgi:DNA invertase Pin-like site-specific DNA recombinase